MEKCPVCFLTGTALPQHPPQQQLWDVLGCAGSSAWGAPGKAGSAQESVPAHTSSGVTNNPQNHLASAVQRSLSSVDGDVYSV